MKLDAKIISFLFPRLESNDAQIYDLCKRYVDRYRGENNDDILTNGELDLMNSRLANSKVVVDAGANAGSWASLALKINPKVQIHCFEPSEGTFKQLLEREFPPNVTCNNFGLGARSEESVLYVFSEGSGMNSLYQRRGLEDGWGISQPERQEKIRISTLDDYCCQSHIEHIDYLKVDVEGHELQVFNGSASLFSEGRISAVQFEYGGCNIDSRVLLKDFFEFFAQFHYDFFKIYPKRLERVQRYDQRLENYQYQNWALIRRGDTSVIGP